MVDTRGNVIGSKIKMPAPSVQNLKGEIQEFQERLDGKIEQLITITDELEKRINSILDQNTQNITLEKEEEKSCVMPKSMMGNWLIEQISRVEDVYIRIHRIIIQIQL